MKKVVFFAFAALCLLNFAFAEEGSLESLKNAFPGIEFTDVIEIGPVEAGEEVSRRGEKMDAPEITVDPVLATFSAEQQVAIILTKLGMTDALRTQSKIIGTVLAAEELQKPHNSHIHIIT